MIYTGAYLYPPRPEKVISVNQLDVYAKKGFIAQVKKNGTSNIIIISPDKQINCFTRHNAKHKAWTLTEKSSAVFKKIPGSGWYVIAAELMHSKGGGIRDTNYIYDILVNDGEYLIGASLSDRLSMLQRIFLRGKKAETQSHFIIDPNTWLAKSYTERFYTLFKSLTKSEDEGLVIKDPCAPLALCGREGNNHNWQVKCRRADISPNFSF